jgi:hypothetical protein
MTPIFVYQKLTKYAYTSVFRSNNYALKMLLTAPRHTALVPIRFSTAHRLLISLHCDTLKVFQSYAKGARSSVVVEALSYKSEGGGIAS